MMIIKMNMPASMKPGMMPARYSLGTEEFVRTPYSTKLIDGGINMPKVPPAAKLPRNKDSL